MEDNPAMLGKQLGFYTAENPAKSRVSLSINPYLRRSSCAFLLDVP